jgi:hypothetical protein
MLPVQQAAEAAGLAIDLARIRAPRPRSMPTG